MIVLRDSSHIVKTLKLLRVTSTTIGIPIKGCRFLCSGDYPRSSKKYVPILQQRLYFNLSATIRALTLELGTKSLISTYTLKKSLEINKFVQLGLFIEFFCTPINLYYTTLSSLITVARVIVEEQTLSKRRCTRDSLAGDVFTYSS